MAEHLRGRPWAEDRFSAQILQKLDLYQQLLVKWQKTINLVAPSTLDQIWERHIVDSLQLLAHAGDWTHWVDIGSGGGFPGLVVAIAGAAPGREIHLIESDKRKAAFLKNVSRETLTPVHVHCARIEQALPELVEREKFDVISARALAPLEKLVALAQPALEKGATGLFLKGKEWSSELTHFSSSGKFSINAVPSLSAPDGRLVIFHSQN